MAAASESQNNRRLQQDLQRLEERQHQAEVVQSDNGKADFATLSSGGWRAVWPALFGDLFESERLAPHHHDAMGWHWEARHALLGGEQPDYDAYMAIWARGHIKTTIARRIAVLDAALSGPGYCLYVGGTQEKIRGHALSIETLLTSKRVKRYFPLLGQVRKGKESGQSKGWTQYFIYTDHGYVFHFVSLEQGVAGANVDNVRPSLIVPDDIDGRKDSPALALKKTSIFLSEVLPTKQKDTLVFHAQNLINRRTVTYHIFKGKIRALARRKPTKAIPAFYDLKHETRTVEGKVIDVLVSGRPSWPQGYSLERGQADVDTYTLDVFKAECQHEVESQKEGLVLKEWDERVHVITWSQFEAVFGRRDIPARWWKAVLHDWGNTHPCVVSALTVASEDSLMPGVVFLFAGKTFPQNTRYEDVALEIIERFAVDGKGKPLVDTSPLRNLTPNQITWRTGRVTDLLDTPRAVAKASIRPQVREWLSNDRSWGMWHMSHEQKTIRDGYQKYFGLPFVACNPGAAGGVDEMGLALRVDYNQPHPFKPGERGRAGMYVIVADDQYYEEEEGGALTSLARDDYGLKLWRDQFPDWQWVESKVLESGLSPEKPMKIADDCGNSLMMYFCHLVKKIVPLTDEQRIDQLMPEELRAENFIEGPKDEGQQLAYWVQRTRAKKLLGAHYNEEGQEKLRSKGGTIDLNEYYGEE